ncbi:MAG: hypothetical protein J5I93_15675 [Pirellulaceae bacterium]|nr:hypothetical protein [Pirellulaceae bacterium]
MTSEQKHRAKRKRGIVLLVVISLLALFVLIGVTYAIVAGQYRRAAQAGQRFKEWDDDPRDYLDRAFYQAVRDTNNASSVRGHSLLEDLYGNDGVVGRVDVRFDENGQRRVPTALAGGQLVRFSFADLPDSGYDSPFQPFNKILNPGGLGAGGDDYYNGRVLTFLTGSSAGYSVRVVDTFFSRGADGHWGTDADDDGDSNSDVDNIGEAGWDNSDDRVWLVVEDDLGAGLISNLQNDLAQGLLPTFIINGRQFNGTGHGLRVETGTAPNLDAYITVPAGSMDSEDRRLVAFLPHFNAYRGPTRHAVNAGGADESWDAADYQNMFLAMVPPNLLGDSNARLIPSFHRPELVHYWRNRVHSMSNYRVFWPRNGTGGASNAQYRDFRRMVFFRPMPWDHPNFTGSNRLMDELLAAGWNQGADGDWGNAGVDDDGDGIVDNASERGWPGSDDELNADSTIVDAFSQLSSLYTLPSGETFFVYDVDNDGDGIPDSVWLDLGFPVKTSPDGRKYKPLFAFLIEDLDGRLNLNAHSNLAHYFPAGMSNNPYGYFSGGNYRLQDLTDAWAHDTNTTRALRLPRGLGFGPAETNLGPLFTVSQSEFGRILLGRYGSDGLPGRFNTLDDPLTVAKYLSLPDDRWLLGLDGQPGIAGYDDDNDGTNDNIEETGAAGSDDIAYSYYGSPWDTRGIGGFALNHNGHPHYQYMGLPGDPIDDPYEMLLNARTTGETGAGDTPYTVAELERLLRWSDVDSLGLPDRLIRTAPNTFHGSSPINWRNRRSVTTHSSHIPMPNFTWPTEFRQAQLRYGQGRDGRWGVAFVDDDMNGTDDDASEAGWPGSDDVIADATLTKLIEARLQAGGVPPAQTLAQIRRMFPFELLRGTPMNINRLLGNGRDDQRNNPNLAFNQVVDEPLEWWLDAERLPPGVFNNLPINYLNGEPRAHQDGMFRPSGDTLLTDPRQALARHLYCMMMFLVDASAFPHPITDADGQLSATDQRELTARRIAQWAVNVVDFRDADGIMTPFEYDVNPFNGWSVDGWIGVGPGPDQGWGDAGVDDDNQNGIDDIGERGQGDDANDDNSGERRLVWGLEYPEVLITETKAFHDRRVMDSRFDNNIDPQDERERGFDMMDPDLHDPDLDQFRVPQGSLYIELYCTRSRSKSRANANQRLPLDLYSHVAPSGQASGRLNLAYVHPQPSVDGLQHPLWRIAISEQHAANAPARNPEALNNRPTSLYTNRRDSASYMPRFANRVPADSMSMLPNRTGPGNELHIDRVIWFTDLFNPNETPNNGMDDDMNGFVDDVRGAKPSHPQANVTFYNSGGSNVNNGNPQSTAWDGSLEPGQYLVIGPRPLTHMGSQDRPPGMWMPSPQRVTMTNLRPAMGMPPLTGIELFDASGTRTSGNPLGGMGVTNIQPVLSMVADMDKPNNWVNNTWPNGQPRRIGLNISEPERDNYYPEPNVTNDAMLIPFDAYGNYVTGTPQLLDIPLDSDPNRNYPLIRHGSLVRTGTYSNVRSAFLQRLADPTRPWHPNENPYITVDWASIDLTVFNGEDQEPGGWPMDNNGQPVHWDPSDPDPDEAPHFETRQRGHETTTTFANVWSPITAYPDVSVAGGAAENFFRYSLEHTLGFLNRGRLAEVRTSNDSPAPYIGDPRERPFPWLAWNNRPFANPLELLNVPAEPASRMTAEFSENRLTIQLNPAGGTMYDNDQDVDSYRAPYRYLLNFFNERTKLYRIFDYLETPSPFVGTERWYNSQAFYNASMGTYYGLAPPFNYISRYRDPGRININTIHDPRIWEAISKGFPAMDPTVNNSPTVDEMFESRQGYAGSWPTLNSNYPSIFSDPFRSAASADLMPLQPMRREGIDATLMRGVGTGASKRPLFDFASTDNARDTRRNPALRYQGLQRLSNLVTTHSNVFAIWITVGYFEVQASPVPPSNAISAHPDGYMLGPEIGEDSGTVRRHRSFYIIDRSMPVGYIPGENRDVDRAVLLRRFIE